MTAPSTLGELMTELRRLALAESHQLRRVLDARMAFDGTRPPHPGALDPDVGTCHECATPVHLGERQADTTEITSRTWRCPTCLTAGEFGVFMTRTLPPAVIEARRQRAHSAMFTDEKALELAP